MRILKIQVFQTLKYFFYNIWKMQVGLVLSAVTILLVPVQLFLDTTIKKNSLTSPDCLAYLTILVSMRKDA